MRAKRWSVIGLFVMALQAGFSLPVMADTTQSLPATRQLKVDASGSTMVCAYLDQLLALPEPIASLVECQFFYVGELSPEARRLALVELSDQLKQVKAEAEAEAEAAQVEESEPAAPQSQSYGGGVEQWRGLVAKYFAAGDVDHALSVIDCESIGGNPGAVNDSSGASGLFQHMPRYWAERSAAAGWSGADIFNPEANIAVAAWLVYTEGWHHWPNCG